MNQKKPKHKILILVTTLVRGGCELHLLNTLPFISKERFQIEVFVIGTHSGVVAEEMKKAGIHVHKPWFATKTSIFHNWMSVPRLILIAIQLWWTLLWSRPNILHCFLPLSYLLGTIIGICARTETRIMSRRSQRHYQKKYPFFSFLECQFHKITTVLLGNSKQVVHELIHEEGANRDKTLLIYNGVKIPPSLNEEQKSELRHELNIDPKAIVLSCVANLIPYKGHKDLIRALALIKKQLPQNWRLLLIGRDDGIGNELKNYAAQLGIEKNIKFLGSRSDVNHLLSMSDIGLLMTHQEGFSNAILEGMACGLPMIVTDVGGNPEAVVHNKTGLIVPAHNPANQAAAILKLVNDKTLRDRMGQAGQERINTYFSIENCASKYTEIYDAILSNQSQKALHEIKQRDKVYAST